MTKRDELIEAVVAAAWAAAKRGARDVGCLTFPETAGIAVDAVIDKLGGTGTEMPDAGGKYPGLTSIPAPSKEGFDYSNAMLQPLKGEG